MHPCLFVASDVDESWQWFMQHAPRSWQIVASDSQNRRPEKGVVFGESGSNTTKGYSQTEIDEEWLRAATDAFTLAQCEVLYVPTYSSFLTLPITLSVLRDVPVYFYQSVKGSFVEMRNTGIRQAWVAAQMRHRNVSRARSRQGHSPRHVAASPTSMAAARSTLGGGDTMTAHPHPPLLAGELRLPSGERCQNAIAESAKRRVATLVRGQHQYGLTQLAYHANAAGRSQFGYIHVPKVGSNTMKHLMRPSQLTGSFGELWCNGKPCDIYNQTKIKAEAKVQHDRSRTYFSLVMDPLERFVAAFYELHHRDHAIAAIGACSSSPWAAIGSAPTRPDATADSVIKQLEALVSHLEQLGEKCKHFGTDEHLTAQTVFFLSGANISTTSPRQDVVLLAPRDHLRMNVRVAMLANMTTFVSALALHHPQLAKFLASAARGLGTTSNSRTPGTETMVDIDVSDLQPALARRICALYRVDYCCIGLPLPAVCQPFPPCP
jgi:hypothetical protein